jgi:hypothetical protein
MKGGHQSRSKKGAAAAPAQAMFALDWIGALAPKHPEWKTKEPFKSVLEDNRAAIAKFSEGNWAEIIGATARNARLLELLLE